MEGQSIYFSVYEDIQYSPEKRYIEQKSTEQHFTVESLLDFPNEDDVMKDAFFDSVAGNSTDSSNFTAVDSCNSSVSGNDTNFPGNYSESQFSGDLCVPYEDLAELEWLSNFVGEDSYSNKDQYPLHLHNLHFITGSSKAPGHVSFYPTQIQNLSRPTSPTTQPDGSLVPPKAQRSKRSRAAPCDWSSRLLHFMSPTPSISIDMTLPMDNIKPKTPSFYNKREGNLENTEGRRCLHCASEKTPQWRTGPMGPKTLCNACGVRYKSGRLVPEYRPANSPTFVSTKHSNSHRKVLELRRQREVHGIGAHHHPNHSYIDQHSLLGVSDAGDYLIHHPMGLDYRHMI